jgi:hypothetical protein
MFTGRLEVALGLKPAEMSYAQAISSLRLKLATHRYVIEIKGLKGEALNRFGQTRRRRARRPLQAPAWSDDKRPARPLGNNNFLLENNFSRWYISPIN